MLKMDSHKNLLQGFIFIPLYFFFFEAQALTVKINILQANLKACVLKTQILQSH